VSNLIVLKDRYGFYSTFTGHEAGGHCFWCGAEISSGDRYCCGEHHELYLERFHWPEALSKCIRESGGNCGDCGCDGKTSSRSQGILQVHHIQPLNGTERNWNILNQPENLIALCPSCHGKRHAKRHAKLKPPAPEKSDEPGIYEVAKMRGQLIFEEVLKRGVRVGIALAVPE